MKELARLLRRALRPGEHRHASNDFVAEYHRHEQVDSIRELRLTALDACLREALERAERLRALPRPNDRDIERRDDDRHRTLCLLRRELGHGIEAVADERGVDHLLVDTAKPLDERGYPAVEPRRGDRCRFRF